MSSEIRLKINGMSCIACENVITKELKKLEGIEHVKVNYSKETAEVKLPIAASCGASN